MRIKTVCHIKFINYTGPNLQFWPGFYLCNGGSDLLIEEFGNDFFMDQIGLIHQADFLALPCYIWVDSEEQLFDDFKTKNIEIIPMRIMVQCATINSYLWFIKDNACTVHTAYLTNEDFSLTRSSMSRDVYSNCLGEHTAVTFNDDEISLANTLSYKLSDLLGPTHESAEYLALLETVTMENVLQGARTYSEEPENRLKRALSMLTTARNMSQLTIKISFYMACFECFFSTNDTELQFRLTTAVVFFIGGTKEEMLSNKATMKVGYDIRSKYVHGSSINKSREQLQKISSAVDDLLRKCFNKIINECPEHFVHNDSKAFSRFLDDVIFADAKG